MMRPRQSDNNAQRAATVSVHPTLVITLAAAICFGFIREFLMYFAAVTLHELAHVFTGHICGAKLKKIELTPIGESAALYMPDSMEKWTPLVYAAGPFFNILLGWCLRDIAPTFALINIALGAFNLLPAFPLDGARLGHILLRRYIDEPKVNKLMCHITGMIASLLLALGILQLILFPFNISLFCVGMFLKMNLLNEKVRLNYEYARRSGKLDAIIQSTRKEAKKEPGHMGGWDQA
ncbi:MAG: site-2 protease family protein [Clostridiales bacterium]|jgi:stage IV sporulation protein FB|nr:site-2 protease family protein [Clostridiales bacterium]